MRVLVLLIVLVGCNAPGPELRGIPAQKVVIGTDRFDVRQRGVHIQAMRRSVRGIPKIGEIAALAEQAMEQASGCDVAWLVGDVAIMWGGLSCNGSKPPPVPKRRAPDLFECDVVRDNQPLVLDCIKQS